MKTVTIDTYDENKRSYIITAQTKNGLPWKFYFPTYKYKDDMDVEIMEKIMRDMFCADEIVWNI